MTEIIRHYRVDTGDKQKMNNWPSVSVRVDTDYPDSFRIIGRKPPQPFKRKFANQVLRNEFERLPYALDGHMGDADFVQQYLPKEYDITREDVHEYMTNPKRCGSDSIITFIGYVLLELQDYCMQNPVSLADLHTDYTYWIMSVISEIAGVRDKHLSCDMLEEENPKLKIDRETFQIVEFPW